MFSADKIIAITGAAGFVGGALCQALRARGAIVRGLFRGEGSVYARSTAHAEDVVIGDIYAHTDWSDALSCVSCVIHCAARVHVMDGTGSDALAAYRAVNVEGTRNLAEQAVASGVERLIYLSSIKVNGEGTDGRRRFSRDNTAMPKDPYGVSKWEAEQVLREIAEHTGLEVVIIRPPLIYGPGVKGNLLSMLGWLKRGIPLPLGAIYNKRSLVGIDNLIDLIITCIGHPAAINQTFLVSDDEDLSTSDLLRCMSQALGKGNLLFPVPERILRLGAKLLRKQDVTQRLLGNLQVDISETKEMLSWEPLVSIYDGMRKTAEWYLRQL